MRRSLGGRHRQAVCQARCRQYPGGRTLPQCLEGRRSSHRLAVARRRRARAACPCSWQVYCSVQLLLAWQLLRCSAWHELLDMCGLPGPATPFAPNDAISTCGSCFISVTYLHLPDEICVCYCVSHNITTAKVHNRFRPSDQAKCRTLSSLSTPRLACAAGELERPVPPPAPPVSLQASAPSPWKSSIPMASLRHIQSQEAAARTMQETPSTPAAEGGGADEASGIPLSQVSMTWPWDCAAQSLVLVG